MSGKPTLRVEVIIESVADGERAAVIGTADWETTSTNEPQALRDLCSMVMADVGDKFDVEFALLGQVEDES